jgi:hypothetical protein
VPGADWASHGYERQPEQLSAALARGTRAAVGSRQREELEMYLSLLGYTERP